MTFVLLRGLMRDSRHWNGFAQLLESSEHTVITADLPGNGRLSEVKSPLNIADYASDIWAQLDAQLAKVSCSKGQETICLVGLSMGGMLALEMAKQAPERVQQVILINSSAANLSPWYRRFQLASLAKSIWIIGVNYFNRELAGVSLLEAIVIKLTSECRGDDKRLLQTWSYYRQQGHTSIANGLRQIIASASFDAPVFDHALTNDLANCPVNDLVNAPANDLVKVIVANQDRLAHPSCGEALARFYNTQAIYLDACGHDVSLDKPEPLLHLLLEMVR